MFHWGTWAVSGHEKIRKHVSLVNAKSTERLAFKQYEFINQSWKLIWGY